MISKLFAAVLVGSLTVMGPVAQAEKNDSAGAMMATKMASAVPAGNASAAELTVFPDVPGLVARDTGLDSDVRKPAPTVAWLLAFGFLGVIVLRRTRSGPMI
jgi:hypothetical protein